MPQLPTYNSQERISPQTTAPIQTGAAQRATAVSGPILDAATEINKKWQEANDVIQYTSAKASYETSMADILNRASNDPDYNGSDKYFKEIDKAKKDSLKGFSNNQLAQRTGFEFDNSGYETKLKVENVFRKKQLDFAGVELTRGLDVLSLKVSNASSSEEAKKYNREINTLLDMNIRSGVITREQAEKQLKETKEKSVSYEISNDPSLETKSSPVLQELQKGDNGRYSFLDSIQREKAVKEARQKINENKQYATEVKVDSRLQVLNDFANGKIDWKNSDDLIRQLTIKDPELGEAIKKGTDTLFIPDQNEEAFVEATKKVFSASTKEEVSTYLMNVLNANGNKEIGRERLAILINSATERAKELKTSHDSQPITPSPKQIEISSAVKTLIINSNPLFSTANLIVNFFKNLSSGSSPQESQVNAVKTEVNRTNPLSIKYKVGDTVTNSNGISGEVVGFNDNGSPIIKRKR